MAFIITGDELSKRIRKELLGTIKDPMRALRMHRTFSYLSSKENRILKNRFGGKLPKAEKELITSG